MGYRVVDIDNLSVLMYHSFHIQLVKYTQLK